MAETLDWTFYDEASFGTTALVEHQLFASAMGSSSTRTPFVTNSAGASQLQNNQSFEINCIKVWVDSVEALADLEEFALGAYVRMTVQNKEMLRVPLVLCFGAGGWQGEFHEAANTLSRLINTAGDGYNLMIPIKIPLGGQFEVFIGQNNALANTIQVKLALIGKLTRN